MQTGRLVQKKPKLHVAVHIKLRPPLN